MKQQSFFLPVLSLLVCLPSFFLLTGCGGSHSSSFSNAPSTASSSSPAAPLAVGQARLTILWPAAAAATGLKPNLIPAASSSIVVTLSGPGAPSPQTLTRPASGQPLTSTATFTNLPVGAYTVAAVAHPNADGTGTAQAQASAPLTIAAGQTAPLNLTLGSTITRIAVTPNPASVIAGQTVQLVATAFDSAGNAVLTSAFAWTSGNAASASVDPATGLVTGAVPTPVNPPAPVQITATESESGINGTDAVTVQPATAPITGVVEDSINQGPLSGATVTISRAGVVVDTEIAGQNNREARFTSAALPAGVYTLAASDPDYLPNSVTVTLNPSTLSPGQAQDIGVISLTSTVGRILGIVKGADTGQGLSGATVTLTPTAGGNALVITTDANGNFNDGLVPIGSYRVVASLAGSSYADSAPRMVTITSSGSQTENFVLVVPPIIIR